MNTRLNYGLKLVALLALSLSLCSQAFADRRTSLMGNMLLIDRDDSFIYPQEMLRYNNSLSVDYGPSSGSGNALLIAGPNKGTAIGVALQRGDIMSPASGELSALGGPTSLTDTLVGEGYRAPRTVADLMFAMKAGPGRFGLRLGLTGALASQDPADKDVDSEGQGQFGLRLSLGYTVKKLGNFVLDFVTDTSENLTDDKATLRAEGMMVHAGGRVYVARQKNFKIGILADVSYMSGANTQLTADKDPASTFTGISGSLGGGPVYHSDNKKLKVAFSALLGYLSTETITEKNYSGAPEESSLASSTIIFPAFNVAMEYMVRDWLAFRTGAVTGYNFSGTEDQDENLTTDHGSLSGLGWNAGVGFIMENLRIDATFTNDFLTAGPYFISGVNRSAPLFSLISATGKF